MTPVSQGLCVRVGLMCCATTTLAAVSLPAFSQEPAEPQTVVVTGSRIRQDPLNQPAPLITVTEEDIAKSGTTSVADLLQRMPMSGGGLNTKFNTSGNIGFPPDQGGVGAGAATADLRHLGSKRVLVLVDGVRWVNESSASGVSSATDLNTIPTSIIDHIEVLQDGASSIYGSDAIAGVINIITKRSFSGLEFSGYGGGFDKGDGNTQQWSISSGASGDRLSTFLNLSYVDQGSVSSADRPISAFPTPGVGACTGRCSSGTPQGRFLFVDPNTGFAQNLTVNSGVTGVPRYNPAEHGGPRTDDFHDFTTADRFNFQPFNFIMTPSQRFSVYAQGESHITDQVSFYLKGLFNNRRSTNQAAPEPLFVGPEAGNGVGNLLDVTSIDATNPYNPFGFTLNTSTDPTTGGTDYVLFRRPVEGGPRIFKQDVNTWYMGAGFRGQFELATRDFYWDVSGVWSRNHADQITNGSYNALKIQNALGPAGRDAAGNLVCGVANPLGVVANPIPGCVPLNLFGGRGAGQGTITPAMLTYIQPTLHDSSEQELKDFTANFTGTILPLPAGGLDFAIGYEHRTQSGSYQPDAIYVAGESAGVPSLPTKGDFDVNEFYGELRIPLLKEAPGADLLQLTAAARSSDYSTFGTDTTTKFGLNWRPLKDLLFRGSYAEGIRAPGIGELFGTFARFDTTIQDPCSDYAGLNGGPAKPAATQANCLALGVPNSYVQSNPQISVVTGGNPVLIPETSKGYTAGLVYSPLWGQGVSWSDNLSMELTYYKITLDRTIQARDAQLQLDACVANLDPVLCGGVGRTGGGTINRFNNQLINIGGTETKGFDFNLRLTLPETRIGRFVLTWANTRLDSFVDTIQTATGFQDIPREGTERGDPAQAYPEWKSTLTADWTLRDFGAAMTVRYTDSVTERCRGLAGLGLCSDYNLADDNLSTNKMAATTYVDLQATWTPSRFNGVWAVTVGVNNVLDEDAPFCFSCASNSFDASTYDVPGVFWYGRVVAHFGKD
jgi:iron complex outermembrane receptor protein